MYGFIIVLIFIFVGFALIFLNFDRESAVYGDQLYGTYNVMFGNVNDSDFSVSQKLFASLILFLLNVVLLNLLISIMGDSYQKMQEKQILTDALTRLDMSIEAMVYLRILKGKRQTNGQGYFIFCGPTIEDEEEDSVDSELNRRIMLIQRTMENNHTKTQEELKENKTTNQKIETKIDERITYLETKMKEQMKEQAENMKGQMEQMKKELKDSLGEMLKELKPAPKEVASPEKTKETVLTEPTTKAAPLAQTKEVVSSTQTKEPTLPVQTEQAVLTVQTKEIVPVEQKAEVALPAQTEKAALPTQTEEPTLPAQAEEIVIVKQEKEVALPTQTKEEVTK